jgi:large subunit ribosomal protein L28
VCDLTGKRANNGYVVTFSHKRNKKLQQVNLQYKKVFWPEGQRCAQRCGDAVVQQGRRLGS